MYHLGEFPQLLPIFKWNLARIGEMFPILVAMYKFKSLLLAPIIKYWEDIKEKYCAHFLAFVIKYRPFYPIS